MPIAVRCADRGGACRCRTGVGLCLPGAVAGDELCDEGLPDARRRPGHSQVVQEGGATLHLLCVVCCLREAEKTAFALCGPQVYLLRNLNHENLVRFYGACMQPPPDGQVPPPPHHHTSLGVLHELG